MAKDNGVKVAVRFGSVDAHGVEEGRIDVSGEAGRWADAGWYAPILRVRGALYLHRAVAEAIGIVDGPARHEAGAIKYGRGRASATYVPLREATVLRLADPDSHYLRFGNAPERERDRNAAIVAFAYAAIDHLPPTCPHVPEAVSVRVPVATSLGGAR